MLRKVSFAEAVTTIRAFRDGRGADFIVVVGPFGSGKTQLFREALGSLSGVMSLSLEVGKLATKRLPPAKKLEELDTLNRAEFGRKLLTELLDNSPTVAYLDNVEIFYDTLPLEFVSTIYRLRHSKSGARTLLTMPGYVEAGKLVFIDKPLLNVNSVRGMVLELARGG